ncbi:MAG TPA: hypothetical protein VH436_13270 [Vicinamibacterales bacterium]|jgi:hypothetical protein
MSEQAPKPPKRPYAAPRLITYGDVTTLTQHNKNNGPQPDKGNSQKNRTG